jgi:hypothetical protein
MNPVNHNDDFRYLFRLQESGRTNMFGAGVYLQNERGLDRQTAREVLTYWMSNYETLAQSLNVEV